MSTPRTCPSCGAQVSAGERFCANCGSRMPDTPAAGTPAIEPTQALPSIPTPPPGVTPPPAAPAPFSVPADAVTPPARRGLPVWLTILLATAGLCGVACVAGFVVLGMLGQRVSEVFSEIQTALEADSGLVATPVEVPTMEDLPTREAVATAEAIPTRTGGGGIVGGAGGGAGGNAAPIQTAAARTAEAIVAEAQALQATAEIAAIFAGARQIFTDSFVDNRNAWFTGVFQEIETDKIEDGVFKVIWAANGSSYELYEVREVPNFIAEVDCVVHQGGDDGSCGLIFGQKDEVGFYKYELFNNYYRLSVVDRDGEPTQLVEGDPGGIVRPNEVNRLRVIKRGDEIKLYLNEVLLDTVSDSTYPTGKIGVSTNSYSTAGGVEVWFDNFTIWELP